MSGSRKPAPDSNSWAQSSEQGRMAKAGQIGPKQAGPPTNRSKYEDKQLPPTPKASSSNSTQAGPEHPSRIKPVTPIVKLPPRHHHPRDREVTDPILSQPLMLTKTTLTDPPEVPDSDSRKGVLGEEMPLENQPLSLPHAVFDAGSEITRAYPVADSNQGERSSSAPIPTNNTRNRFPLSSREEPISPLMHPDHLQATNLLTLTPPSTYVALANTHMGGADGRGMQGRQPGGMIMGDGMLNPTKGGGYGRVGRVRIVDQNDSQRVISHIGVIETVESAESSNAPSHHSHSEGTLSHLDETQPNFDAHQSQPSSGSIHTESNYGGVWENHPHVGRSLPPYTLGSPHFTPHPDTISQHRSISSSSAIVPIMLDDFHGAHNRQPPSVPYNNSWMPNPRENPYASFDVPSAMNNPQPTAIHSHINPVPPPPGSYPGYQPSVQIPASMEHIERGLHHHFDQCFGSMSRLTTDKSDKVVDQVLSHLDHSDEKMERALKGIKGEIRELKKDAISRHREIKEVSKAIDSMQEQVSRVVDTLKELGLKIDGLEKKTDEESDSGSEHGMVVCQTDESMRRRTESAHATLGHNEQRRRRPSRTLNGLRQGRQVSRGRQNTTDDDGGSGARRHAGRSTLGQHYTQVGASLMGEPPDLSQHPAYRRQRGQSREYSQGASRTTAEFQANGSTSYQTSSLQNVGWYHQAYGR